MQQKIIKLIALAFLVQVVLLGTTCQAQVHADKAPYPTMTPLDQCLMPAGILKLGHPAIDLNNRTKNI
jgi:hypothetical protein